MTYQVLARKWRPRDFASLVGQEHVVRALTHALDGARLHHAYLFTGTRGVGKTTLSRIFAKALNCETGITATPCGVCRACREIDEGRFVDYVEMDAASNRGVDEMAALLERAVYAPDWPSTSISASCSCIFFMFSCICWACFMSPASWPFIMDMLLGSF
jgi:DNA polymerase-3 subunit gamma/tau